MSDSIVITHATRTAVGAFGGSLASVPATTLGAKVINTLVEKAGISPESVDEVIMGRCIKLFNLLQRNNYSANVI